MSKVSDLALGPGHRHQERAYRWARRVLWDRKEHHGNPGGVLLADGVGLGKTYEALGTVATYLSQRLHNRKHVKSGRFHVLVLVPPRLVEKWSDELTDPTRFPRYLEGWGRKPTTAAVAYTFGRTEVFRRKKDVAEKPGVRVRGEHVLPAGVYVVNWNLLWEGGRKFTQLHKTRWDAIIVDEAHHLRGALVRRRPNRIASYRKTAMVLLSATPFQLSPGEMQDLFHGLFGGYGHPRLWTRARDAAQRLYGDKESDFARFRGSLKNLFSEWDEAAYRDARALKPAVERTLRRYVVRNQRKKNRTYFFVRGDGTPAATDGDVFAFDDKAVAAALAAPNGLIELDPRSEAAYLRVRDALARSAAAGKRPFIAGALRQFLSTWGQFRRSSGRRGVGRLPSDKRHPKVRAVARLVENLVREELGLLDKQGWVGKVLVFTTFVGADRANGNTTSADDHGTAATLKTTLKHCLDSLVKKPGKQAAATIRDRLYREVDGNGIDPEFRTAIKRTIERFAASRMGGLLLRDPVRLESEAKHLAIEVEAIREIRIRVEEIERRQAASRDASERESLEDDRWREGARLKERKAKLRQRYATRDLVSRFDGAIDPESRNLHHRGFNSPFAPLVLVVSSVGQEGIDLQTYCKHVIHYDLEWNPARMEQREGRVDRLNRKGKDRVGVYFLVCRGTYDERVFHVMVNRARWHQVLMADKAMLSKDPSLAPERLLDTAKAARLRLDLAPP